MAATSLFISYRDGGAYNQIYAVISLFLIFICELVIEKMITIHKDTEAVQNVLREDSFTEINLIPVWCVDFEVDGESVEDSSYTIRFNAITGEAVE